MNELAAAARVQLVPPPLSLESSVSGVGAPFLSI
jgi:hypothetical protein